MPGTKKTFCDPNWYVKELNPVVHLPMTSEERIDGKNEGFRILMTASI